MAVTFQLVILSAAAQRDGGAVLPLPKSLKVKGGMVTKTLEGLCKRSLLEERPAAPDAEVCVAPGRCPSTRADLPTPEP